MRHLKRLYIYSMLLMSFAIALFPIGSHLEMCSNNEGHCHLTLNFCGVDVTHKNTEENYNSASDHATCNSSAMFHNTEILSGVSTNHKTIQLVASLEEVCAKEIQLVTTLIDYHYNYKDYIELNSPRYSQIIRSTVLII